MGGFIVIAVLTLAALIYVTLPLRRDERGEIAAESSAIREARERKDSALTAIIDVEEEAHVGKLSNEELKALRYEYEREALAALEQLDRLDAVQTSDDSLEAEIAAMRERLACPTCGSMREPGGTCSRCDA
ncbi:MAG TPA: hypothetical protein VJ927_07650 [Actinomycetota bacterium]|nr:hypothetical protein [Actinomycetota bacterium]